MYCYLHICVTHNHISFKDCDNYMLLCRILIAHSISYSNSMLELLEALCPALSNEFPFLGKFPKSLLCLCYGGSNGKAKFLLLPGHVIIISSIVKVRFVSALARWGN